MANTEILKTLQYVRDAKTEINNALENPPDNTTNDDIAKLQQLYYDLEKLESDLICTALDEKIDKLNQYKTDMEGICDGIQQDCEELSAIAKKVALAAKAIGILVDIVTKAAAL